MAPVFRSGIVRSDIPDDLINTQKLVDGILSADAAGRAKMANLFVTLGKVADSAINSAKIVDGTIRGEDQAKAYFVQTGLAGVDTVSAYVSFPTAFTDTAGLQVIGVPENFLGDIQVDVITAGSFSWLASAAGTARWTAIRVGA